MCFGSKSKGDSTDPTEAGPPARQTEVKDPNLFRTPTFEPSKALRMGGRRKSRASGHSPSESIHSVERRGRTSTSNMSPTVSPGTVPDEKMDVRTELGDEIVPTSNAAGAGMTAPEIQGLVEAERRGGEVVIR